MQVMNEGGNFFDFGRLKFQLRTALFFRLELGGLEGVFAIPGVRMTILFPADSESL